MRIAQFSKPILGLCLATLTVLTSGCSVINYYGQSVQGQLSILYNRESFEDIYDDPKQDNKLKQKLRSVEKIRHYASQRLQLPKNKSYLYYTDLHRPFVVWNVFAAPAFSLKPVTWCYPIIGCVSYRGYFAKENAEAYATSLAVDNNDIYVAGIAAYSTLGWFNDPLLSSMTHWRDRSLAGLIFHELSHQVLYIPNETSFNEAFATAVETMGSILWLLENKPSDVEYYINYLKAQNDFRALLVETRNNLNTLYESDISEDKKKTDKLLIFSNLENNYLQIKQNWPTRINFDYWFKTPINNARFTASMTYLQLVPAFYTIFIESNGDWQIFYKNVIAISELDKKKRDDQINLKLKEKFAISEILTLLSKAN